MPKESVVGWPGADGLLTGSLMFNAKDAGTKSRTKHKDKIIFFIENFTMRRETKSSNLKSAFDFYLIFLENKIVKLKG